MTRHKKGTHYLTHLHEIPEKDKTLETKQINSFRGINEKMQERTFEGDRNVQYLVTVLVKNYKHSVKTHLNTHLK